MSIEELIASAKADGSYTENAWVAEEGNVEVVEYSDMSHAELFAKAGEIVGVSDEIYYGEPCRDADLDSYEFE